MAIPLGTTSRQLASLTRWLLVGVLAVSAGAWWWPGFFNWGATIGGLLTVWALWMFRQIIEGEHTGWGNPMQAVLAVLSLFVLVHLLTFRKSVPYELGGSIDASILTLLGLLALGMMLCQSVLAGARRPRLMLSLLALAAMVGPAAGLITSFADPLAPTLAWLSLCGVCVWLCVGLHGAGGATGRARVLFRVVVAAAVAAVLAVRAPAAVAVGVAVASAALLLVIAVRCKGATRWLAAAGLAAGGAGVWLRVPALQAMATRGGALGTGEKAIAALGPGSSGLEWLGGMFGWAALAVLVGGFALCLVWLLVRSRTAAALTASLVLWPMAGAMALLALLGPHGPFLPATLAAAALTWGTLPAMLDSPVRRSGGWAMVIVAMALLLLLGVVSGSGLVLWAAGAFSGNDKTLHALSGFLMGVLLTWLVGKRQVLRGLGAVAVAIALGGAGELVQQHLSSRGGQWGDFYAHAIGSAAAGAAYLLCIFSRWSESPDARAVDNERI